MNISKIMIVLDPTSEDQLAFERGLHAAKETKAAVHLFACVYESYDDDNSINQNEFKGLVLNRFHSKLNRIARLTTDEGITVTTEVEWDKDWYGAIVRAVNNNDVDLVVKSSFHHSTITRKLMPTSDWTLLRSSPCPILFVKSSTAWQNHSILAAIEPTSPDAEHDRLADEIILLSNELFHHHDTDVNFISVSQDSLEYPNQSFTLKGSEIGDQKTHVLHGNADEVIVQTAKKDQIDLLIMGTVGRAGLKGFLTGNTVEKVLDKVNCDVLVLN